MMDVVNLAILSDVMLFVVLILIGFWTYRRRSDADNGSTPRDE